MRYTGHLSKGYLWSSIFFLSAVLAGCRASEQLPIEDTYVVTPSAVIIESTLPHTFSPTAAPIKTMVPKFTPTPGLITPAPAEGTFADQSVDSPDGEWTALPQIELLSDGYQISLQVFKKDKSVVWKPVDYKGEGLGYSFPTPKHWSSDSRYFYYVDQEVVDGCGEFFPVEKAWKRLDTQTGEVDAIDLPLGRGHAYSPDDSMLAYTTAETPLQLVIQELQSEEEQLIPLLPDVQYQVNAQGGKIVWSPEGDALILAAATGNICDDPLPTFYLFSLQITDMRPVSLYEGKDYIRPLEWDTSGKILVKDWNSKSWWIDAVSGKITTAP